MARERIDKMQAGRELDELVARKAMRLEVLGWAGYSSDPECCCGQHKMIWHDHFVDIAQMGAQEGPIYLKDCACEFHKECDVSYFGHIASCVEVVLPYSTNGTAAWSLILELESRGFIICLLDRLGYEETGSGTIKSMWRCEFMDEGAHAADRPREDIWKGISQAGTAELAICRAALKIFVDD